MEYNTRQTLIAKIKDQHDEKSWDDFVSFYQRYIYVVISRMGVSHADTEDLVQKVLLALWEKLPVFEYQPDKCKFRTWMNSVVRNIVIGYFRKQKRYTNDKKRVTSKRINEHPEEHEIPEIYDIAEKEWKLHIFNLAWGNIKDDFTGKATECFMMLNSGKTLQETCDALNIKVNSAHVFRKRVQTKLHKEIRRLDQELS